MPLYLITHSLLSSWLYAMRDNPYADATTAHDPYEEFLTVLRREPTPTTAAMQNGIDFEDMVTDIVNGGGDENHVWYNAASKAADMVRGGILQLTATKNITVNGMRIFLKGRLDALRAGVIKDIKFSTVYQRGKYIDSTQHPTYFELVPEARSFEYLVSNGTDVLTERYERNETRSIVPVISDFLDWLSTIGLLDLYKEKWEVK